MKYWVKTPILIQQIFSQLIWSLPKNKSQVYLTFDDGPTEKVTEDLLNILSHYKVKATFFCVGANVAKHPDIYTKIIEQGHHIGNHSMTHINGWRCGKKAYLADVKNASKHIKSNLFRPPYGKLNWRAKAALLKEYRIIMWDVAGGDFDSKCSQDNVVQNVLSNLHSGNIIVLHDNEKFREKTLAALPSIIENTLDKGFSFSPIPYLD